MYKPQELRSKSREELLQLISELKGKLMALRFEAATGQLKETHLPSTTKKDIALIFTILKEKELGIVVEEKETVSKPKTKTTSKNDEVKEEPKAEPKPKAEAKPKLVKEQHTDSTAQVELDVDGHQLEVEEDGSILEVEKDGSKHELGDKDA